MTNPWPIVAAWPVWANALAWVAIGLAMLSATALATSRLEALRPRWWLWPLIVVAGPIVPQALLVAVVVAAFVIGAGL